jgi:hypothetical protein
MRVLYSIMLVAFSAFLLFGCLGNAPANANAPVNGDNSTLLPLNNGAGVTDSGASTGAVSGPNSGNAGGSAAQNASHSISPNESSETSPSTPRCSIALASPSILQGTSVGEKVTATAKSGETVTFLCGDRAETLGTNGFFQNDASCGFNTPGEYSVWVKINGELCASAPLHVTSTPPTAALNKSCNLVNGSIKRDTETMYYEALVNYSGFGANDSLHWDCGWRNYYKNLSQQTNAIGVGGAITVYCQYTDRALLPSSIKIDVGGMDCGSINVAGN